MDIYNLFERFQLDTLPTEWVQCLWKDDFSEAVEFPAEYDVYSDDLAIEELMSSASQFIKDWLNSEDPISDTFTELRTSTSNALNRSSLNSSHVDSKSWQTLISNNVQHKAIVSVLSVLILKGKTEKHFEDKLKGLIATDLYLILLAIPGSQVYHIFNPILYSHAIENLKICSSLIKSNPKAKPTSKKSRGRDFEEEDEENNSSDEEGDWVPADKAKIVKLLSHVLNDLLFTLNRFQLKGQDDSLLITIQILILVTRIERTSTSLFLKSPVQNTTAYLASKAYQILLGLCNSDHGEVQETVKSVMREMMPGFLLFEQKGLKLIPKEALAIKDHSVSFVQYLLKYVNDPAFCGVYTLLQHICIKIPDKADLRARGVQIVMELLNVFPHSLYSNVVVWIMSLCYSDQVKYRITGLEIVTKLIHGNERIPASPLRHIFQNGRGTNNTSNGHGSENEDDNDLMLTQQPDFSTHKFLLGTIFSMCQDVSPSVRAKVLSILANLISSNNKNIQHEMESIFVTPYLTVENIETSNHLEKGFFHFQHFLKNIKKETNPNVDPLPGAKAVMNLLEVFTGDEKVFVRKSALQVLANIFLINEKWMSKKLLQVIVDNCCDKSVSVRKLLVQCLTDLLMHYPSHPELPKYWVKGVLPLLADQEIKSQEKVVEVLQTTILDNIVAYNQMKTALHALPWVLLSLIAEYNKRQLLVFACHKWKLSNSLRQSLITTLKTHIGTENNDDVWFLLASISVHVDIKDPIFVLEYFYENVLNTQQVDEYCCQMVTEVVHLSWRQLPTLNQINLCDNLLKHLSQFTVPLPMISRSVDICQLITETLADSPEQGQERIKEWASKLISISEGQLEKVIGCECDALVADEVRLSQYICTVGDVALLCPDQTKNPTVLLIQNLLMDDTYFNKVEDDDYVAESRWKGKVSASVKAVAVATLGKFCLQKQSAAKALVPLFGSLLSHTSHPEIKINSMIVLTDMCIKFTSLVENHLSEMCVCLRDKDLQVRANTLTLLIQLIQEDYLKLRCPLFFHIFTMLIDEEQMIRDMTSSFIINSLLVKQKNALVQHFVESLFHYNGYLGHKTYSKVDLMSQRERAVFSLEGPEREMQRRHIYRFMLEHMLDDDRFHSTYRICTDILNEVTEGHIELTDSGTSLLRDALDVLSCEEIRLSHLQSSSKENGDDEGCGEEVAQVADAVNNLARKTLVTQIVKKNTIENVVPIFINLKHKLNQLKSPLARDLMACLRELMKDYKNEISDILSADKDLAAEIALDMKKLDQDDEEDSENENRGIEILKQAVMDVKALSEVRNSSLVSNHNSGTPQKRRTSRLSTSFTASHKSNKSVVADKSFSVLSNKTINNSNKTSPISTRESTSNKGSPSSIKLSPVSIKVSPGSNRVSPGSSKVSPISSNQSSPKEVHLSQNLTLPSETETNKNLISPSHITQQNTSSQSKSGENNPLLQPQGSGSSVSSCSSEASSRSQIKKQTKRSKRKR